MCAKDRLCFGTGNLGVDGLARQVLGVLLHELTVGRDGVVHDGLEATATQIGAHGLRLTEARALDLKKVVRDERNGVARGGDGFGR